jgi:hypothetical protein
MISGFNHDFIYKGQKFHLQAEDCGNKLARIVTHLFKDGGIIASRKISYADILTVDNLDEVVHELMKDQARDVLRSLRNGEYDPIIYGETDKGELIREKAVLTREPAVEAGTGEGAEAAAPQSGAKEAAPEELFTVVDDDSDPLEAFGLSKKLAVPWWKEEEAGAGAEEASEGGLQLAAPWWDEKPESKDGSAEESSSPGGLQLVAPWWEKKSGEKKDGAPPKDNGAPKTGKSWWKKK